MHLHVIIAFALVIWWPDKPPVAVWVESEAWTYVLALIQAPLLGLLAWAASRIAMRRLNRGPSFANGAQHFFHVATTVLRLTSLLFLGGLLGLTGWVGQVQSISFLAGVPGLASSVVILPFLCGVCLLFIGLYPMDQAIHQAMLDNRTWDGTSPSAAAWSLGQYLNFNLRHHLLVVAVPMLLISISFKLADRYEEWLIGVFRFPWAAEAAPGIAAGVVFVIAPLLLRRIWTTESLPDGPLRKELERICGRVGMSYRDILIWRSGGMMINAAVMGLFPRVRYIMLSDGLLESMSAEQVEGVFGHEIGHVRHRHIQFFLLFAVCSMLFLSGVVELLRLGVEAGIFQLSIPMMQGIGLVSAMAAWGVGFGWVSRRFERQADVYGAHCITRDADQSCGLPCSIHNNQPGLSPPPMAVCAKAAQVFTSALDRVAILNGIPHEERSWRHSSIASRIRFLTSLSGDPARASRFDQTVRRIKRTLLILTAGGLAFTGYYVWDHDVYGISAAGQPDSPAEASQPPRPLLRLSSTHKNGPAPP